ncbi:uncharacterized protein LOC132626729 [Lycium barbarum]|uniref:uncharacterized protein LOC132626729 n=1 Tax=Lycium barbarum TaxID=112863 RepID=UPI00293F7348|nr:uncharacterized protein LOC132626729 [Lycium barbarum]
MAFAIPVMSSHPSTLQLSIRRSQRGGWHLQYAAVHIKLTKHCHNIVMSQVEPSRRNKKVKSKKLINAGLLKYLADRKILSLTMKNRVPAIWSNGEHQLNSSEEQQSPSLGAQRECCKKWWTS